ncbi:MAG: PIN domain-containing protein [Coriobacteriales bacterium]|nr:PIN domain-containing protein [Coriobacteriales bacterium]
MSAHDRLLLDTNILVDYLAMRQPFFADARKLMILGVLGEVELWISASQINDVFYILSQGGKGSLGLSSQESLRRCRSFLHICSLTEQDIDKALSFGQNDLEDASVQVCAEKLAADYIITRDAGFPISRIQAISPAAYFANLEQPLNTIYAEIDTTPATDSPATPAAE